VTLMTIHAAKGLEFSAVFLVGLEEGLLPHRRAVEQGDVAEERRLCYVAMTRARDLLYLSYAHSRLLGGNASVGMRSRFVAEMGAANVTVRVSSKSIAKPRLASVRPGERVVHPRWDAGTVLGVEGAGRDTLVTIEFDRAGRQRLQLCHAPLRRLEGEESDVLAG
jgi:DNA helicase-2/ATP-dependent DNA helicase PcrA